MYDLEYRAESDSCAVISIIQSTRVVITCLLLIRIVVVVLKHLQVNLGMGGCRERHLGYPLP
jgi:hypothetical protein